MTEIKDVSISELILLKSNPRKITKHQFEKLCESIKEDPEFLSKRPCLVNDKDGILEVYAGNQRVLAAKKLAWKSVPCIIEKDIPDEIIKKRIVKDNKHYGEFDFDILANEWEIDDLIGAGFTEEELAFEDINSYSDIKDIIDEEEPEKCPTCNQKIKKKR